MREFEVVMDSGLDYVCGDGITIENGFICIYEDVEAEFFNPLNSNYPKVNNKIKNEVIVHAFNAESVISIREVEDEEVSEDVKVFVTMNNICEEKIEDAVKKAVDDMMKLIPGDRA